MRLRLAAQSFDRLIHFLFGVCFTPALLQLARHAWPARRAVVGLAVAAVGRPPRRLAGQRRLHRHLRLHRLHCVAARWLYSNVPYDAWAQMLTGWSPNAAFGWQRNHFDRLIHFLFGVCFTPALLQLARHAWPALRLGQAFTLAVMTVMCASLVYEWFEWAIALALSPDAAEAYNGQQGDMWDAHADMLMATVGSLLTWPLIRRSSLQ